MITGAANSYESRKLRARKCMASNSSIRIVAQCVRIQMDYMSCHTTLNEEHMLHDIPQLPSQRPCLLGSMPKGYVGRCRGLHVRATRPRSLGVVRTDVNQSDKFPTPQLRRYTCAGYQLRRHSHHKQSATTRGLGGTTAMPTVHSPMFVHPVPQPGNPFFLWLCIGFVPLHIRSMCVDSQTPGFSMILRY